RLATSSAQRSKARTRSVSEGGSCGVGKIDERSGARQSGVTAERRAERLERAVVAQLRGPRPEVVALACPLDRSPYGAQLRIATTRRLLAGTGADLERIGEIQQPHARWAYAEVATAQQRVDVHA